MLAAGRNSKGSVVVESFAHDPGFPGGAKFAVTSRMDYRIRSGIARSRVQPSYTLSSLILLSRIAEYP